MTYCERPLDLGTFTAGEKPAPLQYQYFDWNGAVIDLTGYTAKFVWHTIGGAATTGNAALVDAANGRVEYTWSGAEFGIPGRAEGQFVVGNGTNRWISKRIRWAVQGFVGPTVPNI